MTAPDCSVTRLMVVGQVGVSATDPPRPSTRLITLRGVDENGQEVAVTGLIDGDVYALVPREANPIVGRWVSVTTDEHGTIVSFRYSEECAGPHEPPDNWRDLF